MSGGGIGQGTPPGTRWLRQAAPWMRQGSPEDMFSPQENLQRNQQWALPGPYNTTLQPHEEQQFQTWVKQNKVNWNNQDLSYDMRGFWKAQQAGDPEAVSKLVAEDIDKRTGKPRVHYPDRWKTPYEATFSAGSMWAKPNAPVWVQVGKDHWQYRMPDGHVIYDDQSRRWHGVPNANSKR